MFLTYRTLVSELPWKQWCFEFHERSARNRREMTTSLQHDLSDYQRWHDKVIESGVYASQGERIPVPSKVHVGAWQALLEGCHDKVPSSQQLPSQLLGQTKKSAFAAGTYSNFRTQWREFLLFWFVLAYSNWDKNIPCILCSQHSCFQVWKSVYHSLIRKTNAYIVPLHTRSCVSV